MTSLEADKTTKTSDVLKKYVIACLGAKRFYLIAVPLLFKY